MNNDATQLLDNINVVLPVNHPNNPGSTPLPSTATLFDLGPRMTQDSVDFYRVLAGVKGKAAGWDYDASIGRSGSQLDETVQNFVNRYEFEKVLADGSDNLADQSRNARRTSTRASSSRRPAAAALAWTSITSARRA